MGFLSLFFRDQTTHRRRRRQSTFQRFLQQFLLVFKASVVFIFLPLLISYLFPSLKFFCIDLLPHLWSLSCEFFTRHYLFGLLNVLIVIIVISTHFHQQKASSSARQRPADVAEGKTLSSEDEGRQFMTATTKIILAKNDSVKDMEQLEESPSEEVDLASRLSQTGIHDTRAVDSTELSDDFVAHESISEEHAQIFSASTLTLRARTPDRPLSSSRFANRVKHGKENSDQLKTLRISRPVLKKGDTLEATWKAITEGRHHPLNRHHRKSETWDVAESTTRSRLATSSTSPLHKAETSDTIAPHSHESSSRDGRTHHPRLRRREPSINQEELNRKVESFIAQFNEQIRLQRQESLLNYMQMVDRSV